MLMNLLVLLLCGSLRTSPVPDSASVAPVSQSGTRYVLRDDRPEQDGFRRPFCWNVDAMAFFKDNEFRGEKTQGYTFPGFNVTPKLVWRPFGGIGFEAGLNILYFWGSSQYPYGLYNPVAAQYSEKTTPFMLTPWLRIRWSFTPDLHLVLGSLCNNRNHDLPLPLYNDEWCYSARPESGLQMLFDHKYVSADLWVNWQRYIFFNDPAQEQILAGLSVRPYAVNDLDGWQVSFPVHFVGKHCGGEITDRNHCIQTMLNGAAGLSLRRNFGGGLRYVAAECYALGYHQTADTLYPFDYGWAGYASLAANYRGVLLSLSHWVSSDFVSMMGSPHFGNASTYYDHLVYHRHHQLVGTLSYACCRWACATLNAEASWIHYFPWNGWRDGYGDVTRGATESFTIGLSVRFNRDFGKGVR